MEKENKLHTLFRLKVKLLYMEALLEDLLVTVLDTKMQTKEWSKIMSELERNYNEARKWVEDEIHQDNSLDH